MIGPLMRLVTCTLQFHIESDMPMNPQSAVTVLHNDHDHVSLSSVVFDGLS